jgi:hypothetical protein
MRAGVAGQTARAWKDTDRCGEMKDIFMKEPIRIIFFLLLWGLPTVARPADLMRFWNLTGATITKLYLAPAGTTKWGPDQCANDKDGSVHPDERLKLVDLSAGRYDVKLVDVSGRRCVVKDVTLQAGTSYAFSLSEADLKDCSK